MRKLLPRPCLILLMGVAGSGKSTLAREIVRRLSAVYLDNNHIADAFFPDTRNGVKYNQLRPGFYKALYAITEENLKLGNSVLLDVPHVREVRKPEWRKAIRRMLTATRAELIVIRCLCSETSLQSRLLSRAESRDRWKLRHWREFLEEQPVTFRLPFPHLDINTEQPLRTNTDAAVRYILARGAQRKADGADKSKVGRATRKAVQTFNA